MHPFVRLNPPEKELDSLAEKHAAFLGELAEMFPRLEIRDPRAESLGGGIYRIRATAVNTGFLPTMSEMGRASGQVDPLQIALNLPKKTPFLSGTPRRRVGVLAGSGGFQEVEWLVRFPAKPPKSTKIRLWAPSVGQAEAEIAFPAE